MPRQFCSFALALLIAQAAPAQDKVSPAEAKAATELKKGATFIDYDEKHPDKPIIGLSYYSRTFDEQTAALLNEMKHLKSLGGYDVKFKPGTLKLLKNHTTLETLQFGGSTDLAALMELPDGPPIKHLNLGDGRFTAEHFESVAKVQSLRTVTVYLARIKPEVLRPLHKLKNLETLAAPTDEPFAAADLAGFGSLVQLTCVAPNNSPEFFESLAKMKTLRRLGLLPHVVNGNPPNAPPAGLAKLATADLTRLVLRVPVGDANITALAGMKGLTGLDIDATGVTATAIKSLNGLPKLSALRLVGRDVPADAVVELMSLPALKELRLHVGPVADEGMKAISTLVGLEILELGRFTPGADKATQHIAKLTKLKSLDLSASDLTDAGLKQLEGLKNLTELKIGFTKTTPAGQAAFKKAVPNAKIITFITTGP